MLDQSPLSEIPVLWATPSLLPLLSLVAMTPLFWEFLSFLDTPSHAPSLASLPLPFLKCGCSLGLWPWSSALCTCTASQCDLTHARASVTICCLQQSMHLYMNFQNINDMAEEADRVLHILYKHSSIFKVRYISTLLLDSPLDLKFSKPQPKLISSLPILLLLPSSRV